MLRIRLQFRLTSIQNISMEVDNGYLDKGDGKSLTVNSNPELQSKANLECLCIFQKLCLNAWFIGNHPIQGSILCRALMKIVGGK